MKADNEIKNYEFIEGDDFDGLMSHAIDKAPGTAGKIDTVVHAFRGGYRGTESMQIIDIMSFYKEEKPFPKPTPTPNTEEQDEIEQEIVDTFLSGTTAITISSGSVNNVTIPAEVNKNMSITGEFQNGATITSESSKYIIINNTSEEPIDIVLDCAGTVYLRGKYKDVYVTGKGISVSSNIYPEISGEITFDPDYVGNVSVSANFVGDEAKINYLGNGTLTVSPSNSEDANVVIYAPNGTVEMGGSLNEVTVTSGEDTLNLKSGFHAKVLNILKGHCFYAGIDASDFADEIHLSEGTTMEPMTYEISNASIAGLSKAGVSNVIEDVVSNSRVGFGIFASGKYQYNLNGHLLSLKGGNSAAMYFRGTPTVNIYGPGKVVESSGVYGIWAASKDTVVNIYGGDFEAYTHVLYAYEGVINVYGGSYKMLGENTDLDPHGHYKFLLNCYDANYTAGTAQIHVFGGKYYNFNPAEVYGEPGAPVSYVAEGYHVVESVEEGVPVFTVVPNEE